MIFPQDRSKLFLPVPGPDVVVRGDMFPPDTDHSDPWVLIRVNVPWQVVWHSPSGFGVGYGGSGPADLALNILQHFLPGQEIDCLKGTKCSGEAARLHQPFKDQFISEMPQEGAVLPYKMILDWIRNHGRLRDRLRHLIKMSSPQYDQSHADSLLDVFMARFPEVRLSWGMDPDLDRLRHLIEKFLISAGHMVRQIGDTGQIVTTRGTDQQNLILLNELCILLEQLDRQADDLMVRKTKEGEG